MKKLTKIFEISIPIGHSRKLSKKDSIKLELTDKNYSDKIILERNDFINELKETLYYNTISKKAASAFIAWFDGYKNTEKIIKYEGELYRKSNYRSGFDIVQDKEIFLPPRQITKIKTNVRFPDGINDNFALVTLRSSYQDSGLLMPATGILDSNYTDYLFITVFNSTYQAIKINKGDRLAQLIFIKNNDIELMGGDSSET